MRDIVLVTTYYRGEYLWKILQGIADADGGCDKEVWVAQDHHSNEHHFFTDAQMDNKHICNHFKTVFKKFRWIERQPTPYYGNSYSCLELYREAYETDARFVYLVEDDILVEKDFFRFHETVQAKGDYFCSVGWHCVRNPNYVRSEDPTAYIESTSDYVSWGVCWKREKLTPIVKHCRVEYYSDMTNYLVRSFPSSPMGRDFTEQDGLIQRVLIEGNGSRVVAWPCLKRAYHIGITGYHRSRGFRFGGTLEQRVEQLTTALKTGSLPGLRKDFEFLNDIDTPRGSTPSWNDLKVVQTL